MRIAFYAPLKSPDHPKPSGDRRMARLIMKALRHAGHDVWLASGLRSYDGKGDPVFQREIMLRAENEATTILAEADKHLPGETIEAWFTYHIYYKSPDWIGPAVSQALSIPYFTAELSHARKRAAGPWALNHRSVMRSLEAGRRHFCFTATDRAGLEVVPGISPSLVDLPPFIDTVPERDALWCSVQREALCREAGFSHGTPILLSVAMFRPGDKAHSYRMLAETMRTVTDLSWGLVLVGDGAAREEITQAFSDVPDDRLYWAGEVSADQLGRYYGGSDLYVWPAYNEAYGMAFLEAQSYGLPVVAQHTRGVPDVVNNGSSGLLTNAGSIPDLASAVRRLLEDVDLRRQMGRAAYEFVASERSMDKAAAILDTAIRDVEHS